MLLYTDIPKPTFHVCHEPVLAILNTGKLSEIVGEAYIPKAIGRSYPIFIPGENPKLDSEVNS